MSILLAILFVGIIISAVMAIEAKNLRLSFLSLGALGMGISLVFLILRAPGLAIAQLVVMFLGFLIFRGGMVSMEVIGFDEGRDIFGLAVVVIMIITTFIFGLEVMKDLPLFGKPLLAEGQDTVQHYLLKYRGYDSLGLAALLFTAILGALAILRKKR